VFAGRPIGFDDVASAIKNSPTERIVIAARAAKSQGKEARFDIDFALPLGRQADHTLG